MDINRVPAALQERLGHDGTAGLFELLTDVRKEWTAEVIAIVGDRFERRLVEETSKLRVDMTQGFAAIRQELASGLSQVRQEMTVGLSEVRQEMAVGLNEVRQEMAVGLSEARQEMAVGLSEVRQEMATGFAALRKEITDQRFEILKWAFLFWVGQFFAVAGLVAVLIRFLRPGG
jgi:DNA anti-recombination protein RmuC